MSRRGGRRRVASVTNAEKIKAAIREAIDKPQGELTKADLEKVKMLFIKRRQLTSVSGLAGLRKLEVLGLDGNQLTDISPLAGLTQLEILHLGSNPNLPYSEIEKLQNKLPRKWGGLVAKCRIRHNAKK